MTAAEEHHEEDAVQFQTEQQTVKVAKPAPPWSCGGREPQRAARPARGNQLLLKSLLRGKLSRNVPPAVGGNLSDVIQTWRSEVRKEASQRPHDKSFSSSGNRAVKGELRSAPLELAFYTKSGDVAAAESVKTSSLLTPAAAKTRVDNKTIQSTVSGEQLSREQQSEGGAGRSILTTCLHLLPPKSPTSSSADKDGGESVETSVLPEHGRRASLSLHEPSSTTSIGAELRSAPLQVEDHSSHEEHPNHQAMTAAEEQPVDEKVQRDQDQTPVEKLRLHLQQRAEEPRNTPPRMTKRKESLLIRLLHGKSRSNVHQLPSEDVGEAILTASTLPEAPVRSSSNTSITLGLTEELRSAALQLHGRQEQLLSADSVVASSLESGDEDEEGTSSYTSSRHHHHNGHDEDKDLNKDEDVTTAASRGSSPLIPPLPEALMAASPKAELISSPAEGNKDQDETLLERQRSPDLHQQCHVVEVQSPPKLVKRMEFLFKRLLLGKKSRNIHPTGTEGVSQSVQAGSPDVGDVASHVLLDSSSSHSFSRALKEEPTASDGEEDLKAAASEKTATSIPPLPDATSGAEGCDLDQLSQFQQGVFRPGDHGKTSSLISTLSEVLTDINQEDVHRQSKMSEDEDGEQTSNQRMKNSSEQDRVSRARKTSRLLSVFQNTFSKGGDQSVQTKILSEKSVSPSHEDGCSSTIGAVLTGDLRSEPFDETDLKKDGNIRAGESGKASALSRPVSEAIADLTLEDMNHPSNKSNHRDEEDTSNQVSDTRFLHKGQDEDREWRDSSSGYFRSISTEHPAAGSPNADDAACPGPESEKVDSVDSQERSSSMSVSPALNVDHRSEPPHSAAYKRGEDVAPGDSPLIPPWETLTVAEERCADEFQDKQKPPSEEQMSLDLQPQLRETQRPPRQVNANDSLLRRLLRRRRSRNIHPAQVEDLSDVTLRSEVRTEACQSPEECSSMTLVSPVARGDTASVPLQLDEDGDVMSRDCAKASPVVSPCSQLMCDQSNKSGPQDWTEKGQERTSSPYLHKSQDNVGAKNKGFLGFLHNIFSKNTSSSPEKGASRTAESSSPRPEEENSGSSSLHQSCPTNSVSPDFRADLRSVPHNLEDHDRDAGKTPGDSGKTPYLIPPQDKAKTSADVMKSEESLLERLFGGTMRKKLNPALMDFLCEVIQAETESSRHRSPSTFLSPALSTDQASPRTYFPDCNKDVMTTAGYIGNLSSLAAPHEGKGDRDEEQDSGQMAASQRLQDCQDHSGSARSKRKSRFSCFFQKIFSKKTSSSLTMKDVAETCDTTSPVVNERGASESSPQAPPTSLSTAPGLQRTSASRHRPQRNTDEHLRAEDRGKSSSCIQPTAAAAASHVFEVEPDKTGSGEQTPLDRQQQNTHEETHEPERIPTKPRRSRREKNTEPESLTDSQVEQAEDMDIKKGTSQASHESSSITSAALVSDLTVMSLDVATYAEPEVITAGGTGKVSSWTQGVSNTLREDKGLHSNHSGAKDEGQRGPEDGRAARDMRTHLPEEKKPKPPRRLKKLRRGKKNKITEQSPMVDSSKVISNPPTQEKISMSSIKADLRSELTANQGNDSKDEDRKAGDRGKSLFLVEGMTTRNHQVNKSNEKDGEETGPVQTSAADEQTSQQQSFAAKQTRRSPRLIKRKESLLNKLLRKKTSGKPALLDEPS